MSSTGEGSSAQEGSTRWVNMEVTSWIQTVMDLGPGGLKPCFRWAWTAFHKRLRQELWGREKFPQGTPESGCLEGWWTSTVPAPPAPQGSEWLWSCALPAGPQTWLQCSGLRPGERRQEQAVPVILVGAAVTPTPVATAFPSQGSKWLQPYLQVTTAG